MSDRGAIESNDKKIINECVSESYLSNPRNRYRLNIIYLLSLVILDEWFREHTEHRFFSTRTTTIHLSYEFFLEQLDEFFSFLFTRNLDGDISINLLYIPSFEYIWIKTSDRPSEFPTKIIEYIFSIQYLFTESFESASNLLV